MEILKEIYLENYEEEIIENNDNDEYEIIEDNGEYFDNILKELKLLEELKEMNENNENKE